MANKINEKEIPLLFGDPTDKALFNPKDFMNEKRSAGLKADLGVMFFSSKVAKEVQDHLGLKVDFADAENIKFHSKKVGNKNVIFCRSHIGGPAAATILEEIIALGAKKILFVGSTGTLQNYSIGSIMIPDKAIRDEGMSYHYMKAGKYAYPSKALTEEIKDICKETNIASHKGTTWTTDAPYRETLKKINKYSKEGVICVEMEAASLFAVAKFRKIEIAGLFWVSDKILKDKWEEHFDSKEYIDGAKNAYGIVKKYLEKETSERFK